MVSIWCEKAANELLRQCVDGDPYDRDLVLQLARPECADALFRILIEGLADRFEKRLCDAYVSIFSMILEHSFPELRAEQLIARYQRIRKPRPYRLQPKRIAVLSRVTLGADIAITSVLLQAAHMRFPDAEVWFAGSAKSAELFVGFPWIQHLDVPYVRGTVAQRLEAWRHLGQHFQEDDWLVIDPDSRLTQLGLLPVADDERYLFFESRAYGEATSESLSTLVTRWARETLGVEAQGLIAPPEIPRPFPGPYVTVSLGTADNPAKQMPAEFESKLLGELCAQFPRVIVDRGFGDEEAARVNHAIAGTPAITWSGSFAGFVSHIAGSACYIGYDSAGQHAAAASGNAAITLFKGFVNERMFERWQPSVPRRGGSVILREDEITIKAVREALSSFSRLAPES